MQLKPDFTVKIQTFLFIKKPGENREITACFIAFFTQVVLLSSAFQRLPKEGETFLVRKSRKIL